VVFYLCVLLALDATGFRGELVMAEHIEHGGKVGAESGQDHAPKPLPVLYASIFIVYFVASLVLMEIIRVDSGYLNSFHLFKDVNFSKIHDIFFRYSVVGLLIVPSILIFEVICVGWKNSSINSIFFKKSMSGRTDIACFFFAHFRMLRIPQVIFTLGFSLISGEMIHDFVFGHILGGRWSGVNIFDTVSVFIRYPLYFFLYKFFDYLAHRVDHSRYFWPLHRFHHAAEDFNVFTADRGHPASSFTQSGLKIFPLALLGVPADAIIDVGMLIVVINYLNHSRIDWDFGWFGRYVIQSPLHHQLHHSRGSRQACNLSICPIWDRLGGTWREVTPKPMRLGTSMPYRHGANVVPDMVRDYRDFLRGLAEGARSLTPKPRHAPEIAPSFASDGDVPKGRDVPVEPPLGILNG
jgi:sterol desaturase/sphingolipid hydroxylase (fatty acid hydroxylase superfamily)